MAQQPMIEVRPPSVWLDEVEIGEVINAGFTLNHTQENGTYEIVIGHPEPPLYLNADSVATILGFYQPLGFGVRFIATDTSSLVSRGVWFYERNGSLNNSFHVGAKVVAHKDSTYLLDSWQPLFIAEHDFGKVNKGDSSSKTIILSNSKYSSNEITVTLANSLPQFSVRGELEFTLNPGEDKLVELVFKPTPGASQVYRSDFVISSSTGVRRTYKVKGTGLPRQSVDESKPLIKEPVVFPSPATTALKIELSESVNISQFFVTDITGRMHFLPYRQTEKVLSLDLAHLTTGRYVANIFQGGRSHRVRFQVIR